MMRRKNVPAPFEQSVRLDREFQIRTGCNPPGETHSDLENHQNSVGKTSKTMKLFQLAKRFVSKSQTGFLFCLAGAGRAPPSNRDGGTGTGADSL